MPAPRMNVGWLGHGNVLSTVLETQGHDVVVLEDVADASAFETIVISAAQQQVEGLVGALEPHIRRGQIVIHTSVGLGSQVLDPLEVKGALAMAIAHAGGNRWLVTASDDIAQGIADVLLFESGQVAIAKTDAERKEMAPQIAYAKLISRMAMAAYGDLQDAIGVEDTAAGRDDHRYASLPTVDNGDIFAAYASITDPGFRKAFVEAARRVGELDHNMELEMWGLQEELR